MNLVDELGSNLIYNENITLENCLFGAPKLTKNDNVNKYKYSGYLIGCDEHESFLFPNGGFVQNVMFFCTC